MLQLSQAGALLADRAATTQYIQQVFALADGSTFMALFVCFSAPPVPCQSTGMWCRVVWYLRTTQYDVTSWKALILILWHRDPLLGDNRETNKETMAVAMQQLRKYATVLEQAARNNGSTVGSGVFCVVRSEAITSVQLSPFLQTRPLVREGAPRNQERNCQTYSVFRAEIKIWSLAPDGCFIPRQDWPTDRRS
jgi:hypothetical protein